MEIIQTYGYHGTTRDNANKIIDEQHFNESSRNNEWLGTGVYFFAYRWHADWWITHDRYSGQAMDVLVADLRYTEDQLLDLDDPAVLEGIDKFVREAIEIAERSGRDVGNVDLRGQNNGKRWNFVCNFMRKAIPDIGIITYTFRPRCKIGVSGYAQNQKQICVSDHTIIRNIERV